MTTDQDFQVIPFSAPGQFTGQGGTYSAAGLELLRCNGPRRIMLTPITARMVPGNCCVMVPIDDVPALIKALGQLIEPEEDLTLEDMFWQEGGTV